MGWASGLKHLTHLQCFTLLSHRGSSGPRSQQIGAQASALPKKILGKNFLFLGGVFYFTEHTSKSDNNKVNFSVVQMMSLNSWCDGAYSN